MGLTAAAVMPDARELQRSINERIAPSVPSRAWNSTVAVVVADPPELHQLGSATLFRIADAHFVVTAAHVLQRASARRKTVGISGAADHRFLALAGDWMRSSPDADGVPDHYDVAVHRLADDAVQRLSGMQFLRLSDALFDDAGPRAVYTLFGFPGVWTHPITSNADRLSVKPLEFTTYAYDGGGGAIPCWPQARRTLPTLRAHLWSSAIDSGRSFACRWA